jgi:hypothetical protein
MAKSKTIFCFSHFVHQLVGFFFVCINVVHSWLNPTWHNILYSLPVLLSDFDVRYLIYKLHNPHSTIFNIMHIFLTSNMCTVWIVPHHIHNL